MYAFQLSASGPEKWKKIYAYIPPRKSSEINHRVLCRLRIIQIQRRNSQQYGTCIMQIKNHPIQDTNQVIFMQVKNQQPQETIS